MKLADELKAVGYPKSTTEFREQLADVFANLFPSWTDEDVICRPDEAKRFCLAIRQVSGCPNLCDYVICRTLTNFRKASRVTKQRRRSA